MPALKTISIDGESYFIDYRLKELRAVKDPYKVRRFMDLQPGIKAQLRTFRAEYDNQNHIKELDE